MCIRICRLFLCHNSKIYLVESGTISKPKDQQNNIIPLIHSTIKLNLHIAHILTLYVIQTLKSHNLYSYVSSLLLM